MCARSTGVGPPLRGVDVDDDTDDLEGLVIDDDDDADSDECDMFSDLDKFDDSMVQYPAPPPRLAGRRCDSEEHLQAGPCARAHVPSCELHDDQEDRAYQRTRMQYDELHVSTTDRWHVPTSTLDVHGEDRAATHAVSDTAAAAAHAQRWHYCRGGFKAQYERTKEHYEVEQTVNTGHAGSHCNVWDNPKRATANGVHNNQYKCAPVSSSARGTSDGRHASAGGEFRDLSGCVPQQPKRPQRPNTALGTQSSACASSNAVRYRQRGLVGGGAQGVCEAWKELRPKSAGSGRPRTDAAAMSLGVRTTYSSSRPDTDSRRGIVVYDREFHAAGQFDLPPSDGQHSAQMKAHFSLRMRPSSAGHERYDDAKCLGGEFVGVPSGAFPTKNRPSSARGGKCDMRGEGGTALGACSGVPLLRMRPSSAGYVRSKDKWSSIRMQEAKQLLMVSEKEEEQVLSKRRLRGSTQKVFVVMGPYSDVRRALVQRGWCENTTKNSSLFDFKWTLYDGDVGYKDLKPCQVRSYLPAVSVCLSACSWVSSSSCSVRNLCGSTRQRQRGCCGARVWRCQKGTGTGTGDREALQVRRKLGVPHWQQQLHRHR
jgi:hypothetical protein